MGGSGIEIHAPGVYVSGDMDMVIERSGNEPDRLSEIFEGLGFRRMCRHWRLDDLFVELVPGPVAGPVQEVRVGRSEFRIVEKEVPLRDRVVGFKHWEYTAYGEQAIDMLAAFGDELDESWLLPELRQEDALDALEALEGREVHAPTHLDVEVAQVTRRLALDAVITPARGAAMLELLAESPVRRTPLSPLLPRIWALRGNLTAYDGAYVALAEALQAPLLTFDRKIPEAPGHRAHVVLPT